MARLIRITALVGNPKAGSRTLTVAEELAHQLVEWLGSQGIAAETNSIDLATLGAALFDWESGDVARALETTTSATLLIVASPTYKATYSGLLKLFLDRIPYNGLSGVVAIPLMVAAAPIHGLAVEVHLRPLLVELGASCPTRGLAILESQLPELASELAKWMDGARPALSARVIAAAAEPG